MGLMDVGIVRGFLWSGDLWLTGRGRPPRYQRPWIEGVLDLVAGGPSMSRGGSCSWSSLWVCVGGTLPAVGELRGHMRGLDSCAADEPSWGLVVLWGTSGLARAKDNSRCLTVRGGLCADAPAMVLVKKI